MLILSHGSQAGRERAKQKIREALLAHPDVKVPELGVHCDSYWSSYYWW